MSRASFSISATAFDYPIYHAETRAQWRSRLEHNHNTAPGVWLCSWRAATERPTCPYAEVVEEAICFGWIDSTVNLLDNDRGLQFLTPRKPKSSWTRLNGQRVAEMEAAGLMSDVGGENGGDAKPLEAHLEKIRHPPWARRTTCPCAWPWAAPGVACRARSRRCAHGRDRVRSRARAPPASLYDFYSSGLIRWMAGAR